MRRKRIGLGDGPVSRREGGSPRAGRRRLAVGRKGEDLAARHLESLGYKILHRNWRSPLTRHELDIIAQDGDCLVFVEVKTARSLRFGDPAGWIGPRKQRAIIQAAQAYASAQHAAHASFRFDAITIAPSTRGASPVLTHREDAFTLNSTPQE